MYNETYHELYIEEYEAVMEVDLFDGESSLIEITMFHHKCPFCIARIIEGDFKDIPAGSYRVELPDNARPYLVRIASEEEIEEIWRLLDEGKKK